MEGIIAAAIGGLIFYFLIMPLFQKGFKKANSKVRSLDDFVGKSYDEIIDVLGEPSNSRDSYDINGYPIKVCDWDETDETYGFTITFDEWGTCRSFSY